MNAKVTAEDVYAAIEEALFGLRRQKAPREAMHYAVEWVEAAESRIWAHTTPATIARIINDEPEEK